MSDASDQGQGWAPPQTPPGGSTAPPPPPPGATPPPPAYAPTPAAYPPQPVDPTQPGYGFATYYPQVPRTEGLAVAALVCGIVSIPLAFGCLVGVVPGVVGLVLGLVAISRINRSQGALTGKGMALAGAICGGVGILAFVAFLLIVLVASLSA